MALRLMAAGMDLLRDEHSKDGAPVVERACNDTLRRRIGYHAAGAGD
jgi:hypothetical protein